jgi:hypothetical protein
MAADSTQSDRRPEKRGKKHHDACRDHLPSWCDLFFVGSFVLLMMGYPSRSTVGLHTLLILVSMLICSRAQTVAVWSWTESLFDPDLPSCRSNFSAFMSNSATAAHLTGGSLYLSTNFMFLCSDSNNTRRLKALPTFMQEYESLYSTKVSVCACMFS